jgi:ferredoxin
MWRARDRVFFGIAALIRAVASLAGSEDHRVRERVTDMKVWIDQDLCTGDGLCEEIAPDVFTLLDDGLAYVKEGDKVFSDPGGAEGLANVPAGQEEAVIEAAEECPGECIFIEVE